MKSLSLWMIEFIRGGDYLGWMEEKRFELVPQIALSLKNIVDEKTIVLVTDKKREWFYRYALSRLNPSTFERPLIPIVGIESLFMDIDTLDNKEKIDILDDMLGTIFDKGFSYFYVGDGDDKRVNIAKSKRDSMLWFFDKRESGALYLDSKESRADIKLLELLGLYESSIEATLFGDIDLEGAL